VLAVSAAIVRLEIRGFLLRLQHQRQKQGSCQGQQ
jgi:hypothetical protein